MKDYGKYKKLEKLADWVGIFTGLIFLSLVLLSAFEIYLVIKDDGAWIVIFITRILLSVAIWISGSILSEWLSHLARLEMIAWEVLDRLPEGE